MRSPPFGDGNASFESSGTAPVGKLQWGHRLSAMETGVGRKAHVFPHSASMGPPPFGDGNEVVAVEQVVWVTASMEPPPFGDGN